LRPNEDWGDHVAFSSKIIYEFFNDYLNLGGRARDKRIPSIFLNLKKRKTGCLAKRLF
jgi:hypothetical protein